jgi:hypothetical protein
MEEKMIERHARKRRGIEGEDDEEQEECGTVTEDIARRKERKK